MTCYGLNETAIALLSEATASLLFRFTVLRMQLALVAFFARYERRLTFFFVAKQDS